MPSKKQQATDILAKALGVDAEAPPPPPAPVQPVAEDPPPPPVTEEPEAAADDGVSDEPATLADLANALGIDASELYEVMVPQQDGAEPVPLGKLKDAEGRARQLEKKLRGLESDHETTRKELDTLRSQGQPAFGGIPPELDQLRLRAAQWHEYVNGNETYWNQLQQDDPAQYAAEFTKAQHNAQLAVDTFQRASAGWQAEQQRLLKELTANQRRKLAEDDAAWADEDTHRTRLRTISEWLRSEGATVPDDLGQTLTDPGWTKALFKAAAAAQGLKAVEGNPVRKVGTAKLTRGSLKRGGTQGAKLVDIIKRARETGRASDKRAAGEAILANALPKKQPR